MQITDRVVRQAWLSATISTWRATIRDIEDGQPDDREWIGAMWRDLGWGSWFLDERGGPGYDEAPESWCGAGLAWIGRHRIGEHIEPDERRQCVDLRIHPHIASQILPGTDRMYDRDKWGEIDLEFPGLEADKLPANDLYQALEPGVIVTRGSGPDGSHIMMVHEVDRKSRTFNTVECNAFGVLGDEKYGEGIVRRYDTEVEDYQGETHPVEPRSVAEIKMIYPPTVEWCVGESLER